MNRPEVRVATGDAEQDDRIRAAIQGESTPDDDGMEVTVAADGDVLSVAAMRSRNGEGPLHIQAYEDRLEKAGFKVARSV